MGRAKFLQVIQDGGHDPISYSEIVSVADGHEARFQVFSDALKINGVRITASAALQEQIADALDCDLLTPKLADLIWSQRDVTLPPFTATVSVSNEAMIEHSRRIDVALKARNYSCGLVATVGKHWVRERPNWYLPGRAINYGWHFEGPTYKGIRGELSASGIKDSAGNPVRVIQGRGRRHSPSHYDYSQTVVLVRRDFVLDGSPARTEILDPGTELDCLLFG